MKTAMYNTEELTLALKWTFLTTISMLFGNITPANITFAGLIATLQPLSWLFSIGAAFMAMRHWYYATKKVNDKNKPNP